MAETDITTHAAQIEQHETEIRGLKILLKQTDYIALKLAEGEATHEEYSEIIAKRKEWRAKINEYQASVAALQEQVQTISAKSSKSSKRKS